MNSYWTIRSRKLTWNLRLAVGRLFQWFFLFSKGVFAVPCSFWGVYSPSWTPIRSANKKKLSTTPPHLLTCTVAKILEDYNPTTTHARFEQINTDSDNCHVSGFFRMTKSGSIMMNKMWKVILKETKHKCLLKKSIGSAFQTRNNIGMFLGLTWAFPLQSPNEPVSYQL